MKATGNARLPVTKSVSRFFASRSEAMVRYDHAVWIFGTESCSEEAAYGLRHWQAGVSSRFQANPISLPQPEGRVNENQR